MADRISEQTILEKVYNKVLQALTVVGYGYDGTNTQVNIAQSMALKTTKTGTDPLTITYIGMAAPGTAQSTAKWQCKKIDSSVAGTMIKTYADGDAEFDNVATDLTALTYS